MSFRSESSTDGKVFKPVFIEGRMRKYENLNNALNGAKQLLKNPKNKIVLVRVINETDTTQLPTYVRKVGNVYETAVSDRPENVFVKKTDNACIEITCVSKNKMSTSVENLIDKVTRPVKELMSKESRIQFLKDAHDRWKQKKENPPEIKTGDSVNNLSDNHNVKKVTDIYACLMGSMIDDAISQNNPEKLFKLEMMLSQGGYSWYYKNNDIHVDTTENVIEKINKMEIILDD